MLKKTLIIILVVVLFIAIGCAQQQKQPPKEPTSEKPAVEEPSKEPEKPPAKAVSAEDMRMAQALVKEGKKLRWDRKYKEAMLKYKEALEKNPNEITAYEEIASVQKAQKDYSDAVSTYDKALAIDPKNPKIWAEKAKTLRWQNKYEDAIDSFKKALEFDEKNLNLYREMSETYKSMNKFDEAEKVLDDAVSKFPDNRIAYEYYARYWKSRAFAKRDKKESAELFQKSADWYEKAFDKITEKDTFFRPGVKYQQAEIYYQKWKRLGDDKDKEMSIKIFAEFRKLKPDHVWGSNADRMIKNMKEGKK